MPLELSRSLGILVRVLLSMLSGWMVGRGYSKQVLDEATIAVLAPALTAVIWSVWRWSRARCAIKVALDLPAGATEADLKNILRAPKAGASDGQ